MEIFKAGVVAPDFGKSRLPENIIQARTADKSLGNLDNAKVATALAKEAPGGDENNCTGSGPARITPDGNGIEYRMAFPLEWANLYQTWNMAFVTNFENWPYFIVKLLIPSVSDYHSNPSSWIHERLMGHYIHIHWTWMGRFNGFVEAEDINWHSPSLSKNWGRANSESAKEYKLLKNKCH